VRYHENKLRRALEAAREERIQTLREKATDAVLPHDTYVHVCGQIAELKRLRDTIPEVCERILDEEEEDDES
jgi:hypothetical protein